MDFAKPDPTMAMLIVLLGVQGIVGLLASIAQIVNTFRRRPPIDQELINYVRHPELLAAKAELRAELNRVEENTNKTFTESFGAIRTLQASSEKVFADINRTLGRIEGKLSRCPSPCPPDGG